jgi:5-(carboxyamino)imidazole ribonucleotide synthase
MQAVSSALTLTPGQWLGMLGGGQLGRMFCFAAHRLGYKVMVLDPDADSPAGAVAEAHLCAAYDDPAALQQLAERCCAVTTEFENVPAPTLAWLAQYCLVAPDAQAVSIAQDRVAEKRFMQSCGLAVAPHAVIQQEQDLESVSGTLFPAILKAARLGYDGKGQVRVATAAEAQSAFAAMGRVTCVLEKMLPLEHEISVVCARSRCGDCVTFPVAENIHQQGILARSTVPSPGVSTALRQRAEQAALQVAAQLNYVGVLCVEFFVLSDGQLLVNEMAPRPHNSGHYTLDACSIDQFEQQVRAVAGLPLVPVTQHSPVVMLNILGDAWYDAHEQLREPDWASVLALPGVKLHLYGKAKPRRARKMGHINCIAPTLAQAQALAQQVSARLNLAT